MGWVGLAGVLVALIGGQGFAASQIGYTLELGGNNSAALWHAGSRPCFSWSASASGAVKNCTTANSGGAADGQYFNKGEPITWAVRLTAAGNHSQPGHDSDGNPIYGAANVVFDLALCLADGQTPAADAEFYSSINNATTGTDPFGMPKITTAAAFTLYYKTRGGATPPARVVDTRLNGGARMGGPCSQNLGGAPCPARDPITYPTYDAENAKLIGMGAGYKEWIRTGGDTVKTEPGVGMTTLPNALPGLGQGPVAEGQIDTSNMALGTYILKVTPGNGNNVLWSKLPAHDPSASQDHAAFAVAVNDPGVADTITFILCENCVGVPVVTEWRSVRTHTAPVGSAPGACGNPPVELAIVLDPTATTNATVETRVGGIQKIQVDFDGPIGGVIGTIQAVSGAVTRDATSTNLINGNQTLEINWSGGLPDQFCWTIDLAGHIVGGVAGDTDVMVRALAGDLDRAGAGAGTITIGDAIKVNTTFLAHNPCSEAAAVEADVDCNGTITIGDAITVNGMNGHGVTCP